MNITQIKTISATDPLQWLNRVHQYALIRAAMIIRRENLSHYKFSPWRDEPIYNIRNYEMSSNNATTEFTGVHRLQITDREFWRTLSEDPQYSFKFSVSSQEINLLLFSSNSSLYHFLERQVNNIEVFSKSERFPDFALELCENLRRLYEIGQAKRAPINDLVNRVNHLLKEWIQSNPYDWDTDALLRPITLTEDMNALVSVNSYYEDDKSEKITLQINRGDADTLYHALEQLEESMPEVSPESLVEDSHRTEMNDIKSLRLYINYARSHKSS